eukprot:14741138-Alexandrium_andersonii.AAC.1
MGDAGGGPLDQQLGVGAPDGHSTRSGALGLHPPQHRPEVPRRPSLVPRSVEDHAGRGGVPL